MYRVRRLIAKSWCLSRLFCWLHGIPLEGHPQDEIWYFAYGANMHDSGVYFKPPFPRSARAVYRYFKPPFPVPLGQRGPEKR